MVSCSDYSSTLKIEAVRSFGTSLDFQQTMPEEEQLFIATAVGTSNPAWNCLKDVSNSGIKYSTAISISGRGCESHII
jgi:hypothetical protein